MNNNINENSASNTGEAATIYRRESIKDVNGYRIFGNNRLCSQFLNEYVHIPLFSSIRPEDIEDMSKRYWDFLGVEFTGATVKKIRFYNEETDEVHYVFVIIDHKSYVDYNAHLQFAGYKNAIWFDHEITQNSIRPGSIKLMDFKYPLVIKIVYYDGKEEWNAARDMASLTNICDDLKYLAGHSSYELVELRDCSYDDLKKSDSAMSVVMMLNKIQTKDDFDEFIRETESERDRICEIYKNEDEEVKQIIKEVLWSLLMVLGFEVEYAIEIMTSMEVEGLDYLFKNADLMEVGYAYNTMRHERHRANEAELQLDEERSKVRKLERKVEELTRKVEELTRKLQEYEQNSNS